jgi:hypothetical protein
MEIWAALPRCPNGYQNLNQAFYNVDQECSNLIISPTELGTLRLFYRELGTLFLIDSLFFINLNFWTALPLYSKLIGPKPSTV